MRSVSVVVPTIGRPESLRLMLDSIVRQVYPVNELIVADASGEPDTRDLLMMVEPALPGCSVKWIRVESPNAAAQRDLAIRASKSDFVFLVDDDVVAVDSEFPQLLDEPLRLENGQELWNTDADERRDGGILEHGVDLVDDLALRVRFDHASNSRDGGVGSRGR